jgi:hypothetical protein
MPRVLGYAVARKSKEESLTAVIGEVNARAEPPRRAPFF